MRQFSLNRVPTLLLACTVALALIFITGSKVNANHAMTGSHVLNDNYSFESGGSSATSWGIWTSSALGSIERVEGISRTGDASLLIDHLVDRGGPHQTFEAHVGLVEALLYVSTPAGTDTDATVEISIQPKSSTGTTLASYKSGEIDIDDTGGTWVPVSHHVTIPDVIGGVAVEDVTVIATFTDAGDARIFVDDFVMVKEINDNSSFELGSTTPTSWSFWQASTPTGTIERITGTSRTGNASVLLDHFDVRGGPIQTVAPHEGKMNVELYLSTPPGTSTSATIEISIQARNGSGTNLVTFPSGKIDVPETSGAWVPIEHSAVVPAKVGGVDVAEVRIVTTIQDGGDAEIYLDDFVITKEVEDSLVIVDNGTANAVVIVESSAPSDVTDAADNLADYIDQSTDAEIDVLTPTAFAAVEASYTGYTRIYVGLTAPGDDIAVDDGLDGLNDDGFIIHPHGLNITIQGNSPMGTSNGVYEFLERYAGIRWLMPGVEGEDIPSLTDITVPHADVIMEPAFENRALSAGIGTELWWRANKAQIGSSVTVKFMHNLYSLFKPEDFAISHPEYYPDSDPPEIGDIRSWQPCFTTATETVAVNGILDYFSNNPTKDSFSLGINDSKNFCETDPSHPSYPDELNSVGDQDMSDIYYAWVNSVVTQVLAVYPDKWFGVLAYYNVADAPSFALHSRVVPFITKDRMAWIDSGVESAGHSQQDDWDAAANKIGWYDYMYGVQYAVPRVYPHLMAENFQYAADHDVYGHYIEMYHNVGDGPKAWIAAKLMWNPELDVDLLLQEWYERAVGIDAAEELAELYEIWEDFWTNRIKGSPWFENEKNRVYLPFGNQEYLHLVTDEDIEDSMTLINSVVSNAGTALQEDRAEKIRDMFTYYEATVYSYPREVAPFSDSATALDILDKIDTDFRQDYLDDRLSLKNSFESDPILRFRSSLWYDWSISNPSEFWRLVDYMRSYEPSGGLATTEANDLADDELSIAQEYAMMLLSAVEEAPSSTKNSSFESGSGTATSWGNWIVSGGTITRTETESRTGSASLKVSGMDRGGPHQTFEVHEGSIASQIYYYTPPGTTDGTILMTLNLKNNSGTTVRSYRTTTVQLSSSAGTWQPLALLDYIPATIGGNPVESIQMVVTIDGAQASSVYLDDAYVYQSLLVDDENLWELADYIIANEPSGGVMTQNATRLATSTTDSEARDYARLLLEIVNDATLTLNSSFESGTSLATSWSTWIGASPGTVSRVTTEAHTGTASHLFDGMNRGGSVQTFAIDPGLLAARVYFYTPSSTSAGLMKITLNVKSAGGTTLDSYRVNVDLADSDGEWAFLDLIQDIPATIGGVAVTQAQIVLYADDAEATEVYIDDADVFQY